MSDAKETKVTDVKVEIVMSLELAQELAGILGNLTHERGEPVSKVQNLYNNLMEILEEAGVQEIEPDPVVYAGVVREALEPELSKLISGWFN